ncbi:hypothetical protein ACLOJK_017698 [Asimina triloba]
MGSATEGDGERARRCMQQRTSAEVVDAGAGGACGIERRWVIAMLGQADEATLAAGDGGDDDIRLMGDLDRSIQAPVMAVDDEVKMTSWLGGTNSGGSLEKSPLGANEDAVDDTVQEVQWPLDQPGNMMNDLDLPIQASLMTEVMQMGFGKNRRKDEALEENDWRHVCDPR